MKKGPALSQSSTDDAPDEEERQDPRQTALPARLPVRGASSPLLPGRAPTPPLGAALTALSASRPRSVLRVGREEVRTPERRHSRPPPRDLRRATYWTRAVSSPGAGSSSNARFRAATSASKTRTSACSSSIAQRSREAARRTSASPGDSSLARSWRGPSGRPAGGARACARRPAGPPRWHAASGALSPGHAAHAAPQRSPRLKRVGRSSPKPQDRAVPPAPTVFGATRWVRH